MPESWPSHLAEATSCWLTYKDLTGAKGLLNESSLSMPILEFLTRSTPYAIAREVAHPKFLTFGRGRPKQIDFVAKRSGAGWVFAIETKYGRSNPDTIVSDICRLALLPSSTAKRYLLIAGPNSDDLFKWPVYLGDNSAGQDFFDVVLKLDHAPGADAHYIDLRNIDERFRKKFATFQRAYKQKDFPNLLNLFHVAVGRTKLYTARVWEVSMRQGTGRSDFAKSSHVQESDVEAAIQSDAANSTPLEMKAASNEVVE